MQQSLVDVSHQVAWFAFSILDAKVGVMAQLTSLLATAAQLACHLSLYPARSASFTVE